MKLESTLFSCVLGLAAFAIPQAQAQTFNVIYNFTGGNDGGIPLAGLVIDAAGNLYGTTSTGGSSGGRGGVQGEREWPGDRVVQFHRRKRRSQSPGKFTEEFGRETLWDHVRWRI